MFKEGGDVCEVSIYCNTANLGGVVVVVWWEGPGGA